MLNLIPMLLILLGQLYTVGQVYTRTSFGHPDRKEPGQGQLYRVDNCTTEKARDEMKQQPS